MTAEWISVSNAGSQPQNRIKELASQRRRFGCRRLHILLKRARVEVNRKKLYRPYCEALPDLCGVADAVARSAVPRDAGKTELIRDALICSNKCRSGGCAPLFLLSMLRI
jgi:hypothetical protein